MDVPLADVVEIGQVLNADDAPQTLSFERIENDYAIYTVQDCEDQELAIVTDSDLMTVRLIEAVVPQWAKAQAEDEAEETEEDLSEAQPIEFEMNTATAETDDI